MYMATWNIIRKYEQHRYVGIYISFNNAIKLIAQLFNAITLPTIQQIIFSWWNQLVTKFDQFKHTGQTPLSQFSPLYLSVQDNSNVIDTGLRLLHDKLTNFTNDTFHDTTADFFQTYTVLPTHSDPKI